MAVLFAGMRIASAETEVCQGFPYKARHWRRRSFDRPQRPVL
ncbi:MAG: hypothetical protein NTU41_02820 [Chloroflexi bacterium]|nr:hypothetical protein [Chloroflexota bacterium]